MNSEDIYRGISEIRDNIVDEAWETEQTAAAKPEVNKRKPWIKWLAVAACVCLAVGGLTLLAGPNGSDTSEESNPGGTDSEAVKPVDEVILNALDLGDYFGYAKTDGTNRYVEVYARDFSQFKTGEPEYADYLKVYRKKELKSSELADKDMLQDMGEKHFEALKTLSGIDESDFEIVEDEYWDGLRYEADITKFEETNIGDVEMPQEDDIVTDCFRMIGMASCDNYCSVWASVSKHTERGEVLMIDGEPVHVLESDSDEQIMQKIGPAVEKIKALFGKDYRDIYIDRYYDWDQLNSITVYLYNKSDDEFPERMVYSNNFYNRMLPVADDYIMLMLETDWGEGTANDSGGSKDEAVLNNVRLYEYITKADELYEEIGSSPMLTLEEAKDMLEKGYVFGGHSCPLCMAEQPEVDFSDYDELGLEYVEGDNGLILPFYTFFKKSYLRDGIQEYHKTYVCAVELDGLDEYFEGQEKYHGTFGG
ncbi:MAG: hypothetical protein K5653_01760 [Clostridiales bacterium]|nr:hypothetical protein [Clostridiales bacterium]